MSLNNEKMLILLIQIRKFNFYLIKFEFFAVEIEIKSN